VTPSAGWQQLPLSEFIVLQRGFDLPHRDRVPGGFKVLSSGEAHGWHNEGPVKGPGFVVGRATNIGRPTWSDEDYWPLNTVLYAKDFMGNDPKFAYYWFLATDLTAYNSGSVQPMLNRNYIANVPIDVPPVAEQRGIAATLSALDDKIESNRRQLHLLDQLFQSQWNVCSNTAAKRRHLADLVWTQYGLTASAESESVGPKFLRVTDINKQNWLSWDAIPTARVDAADLAKYRLRRGDLVVARMADPGKSAIYDDESVEAVFASYLVRLTTRSWAESLYIYGFLKSPLYAEYAAGAMTGSVQKNMNAKVIVAVDLPFPDATALQAFTAVAEPIRAAINQKVRENSRLSSLRDALLPELLAGRIRVPEAEEVAAEVGA
jgi:type I restriction enzyme S subunit